MGLPDHSLLRLHVEASWGVRLASPARDDIELLPDGFQPAWRLSAADLTEGRVHIWRPDVSAKDREALRMKVSETLALPPVDSPRPGVHQEVALSQIASSHLDEATARIISRSLTEMDQSLIETYDPGWHDYYFNSQKRPLIGVVISDWLVSVAHSSRRTSAACELGISTLTEARRKGYALAATIVWTREVMQEGLIPIYSADASNAASLRLANAAGYRTFARLAMFE
jgi:GNAT acetyltransferase